jgi:enoyl-CoA hydratase
MSVNCVLDDGVAVITLDDGKANAYSHEVLASLHDALDQAEKDATAVLLAGRPGRFSAGFDLSVMTSGVEPMRSLVTAGAELLLRVFTFPMPVVMACTGHALAAGGLMLLVGDRRIGAEGPFKIGLNEVAIGMPLPIFAVELARYRMPPSAFDEVVLGDVADPAGAIRTGFLDRVVGPEDVINEATSEAKRLAALRTGAVSHTKENVRGAIAEGIRSTLKADMDSIAGPAA